MSNLLLISAPGAGKGVISKYLVDKYNYLHVSMGNLLREKAKTDKSIDEIIKQGAFVDDNIVNNLLEEFIEKNKDAKFVFEGFPRNIKQQETFEEMLNKYDIALDKAIYINIEKEIAVKRITGRLMCSNCNDVYNKYFDDIEGNKCKSCGGELVKRNDDDVSTYEARYDTFIEKTMPLVNYYEEKDILYTIYNNDNIENVYNQIDRLVDEETN